MSAQQETSGRMLFATIIATALIMTVAAFWAIQGPAGELSATVLAIAA